MALNSTWPTLENSNSFLASFQDASSSIESETLIKASFYFYLWKYEDDRNKETKSSMHTKIHHNFFLVRRKTSREKMMCQKINYDRSV